MRTRLPDAQPHYRRRRRPLLIAAIAAVLLAAAPAAGAAAATPADPFAVLDPLRTQNPDDMTWNDYHPVPHASWADPHQAGSVRNFKIALVALDYPDQPFAVTQAARSTPFTNPQPEAANIARDKVPAFYRDFLNTPGELNRGHTLHEYWMTDSAGRYGVDLTAFGPYKMPRKSYEYGIESGMNGTDSCPGGSTCSRDIRADGLKLWKDAVGDAEAKKYELTFILSAGQDESSTWQEFGQMKFANKDAVSDVFGPPASVTTTAAKAAPATGADPATSAAGGAKKNWSKTRYVDWTSWKSAASIWPNASSGSSTQAESSGQAVFAHELTHLLNIGDNYSNPYANPVRRAYTGLWSMMSRGAFNGPGGTHSRWMIPATHGSSMGSLHTVRDKMKINLVDPKAVLQLSREALADSGLVVAEVTARAVAAGPGELTGLNIKMNADKAPKCDVKTELQCDGGGFQNYTVEVIGRLGPDSFTTDSGVLLSKTKNADSEPYQWVIDSNPQDINWVDFVRPDGTPQKVTLGDDRQLSDALLHAGTRSGSQFEYTDEANKLQFYVLDLRRQADGTVRYTVAVRSLDGGSGPSKHGVSLAPGTVGEGAPAAGGVTCTFGLTNTGSYVAGGKHPQDVSAYLKADVYRLTASVKGDGWRAVLPNALASAPFGGNTPVQVAVGAETTGADRGVVTLTATSVSDPSKTVTSSCEVPRRR